MPFNLPCLVNSKAVESKSCLMDYDANGKNAKCIYHNYSIGGKGLITYEDADSKDQERHNTGIKKWYLEDAVKLHI